MKKIDMMIECPSCKGTGVYSGIGEGEGIGVVCTKCKGTGKYHYTYEYNEFTERKRKEDVERVYLSGSRHKLGLGKINFVNVGIIDMDKEGVSYDEFLEGKMPKHIEKLGCPMLADQSACHRIDGFTNKCNKINGEWINRISDCKHQPHKSECWKRFYKDSGK